MLRAKKCVSSILVIILICAALFIGPAQNAFAATEETQTPAATQNATEEPERLNEVIGLREKNSKTYLLSDGSYEYVGYAEDIHYEDADGNLVEINNAIMDKTAKEGYTYSNTANAWHTYFADSLCEKNAIVLEKDKYTLCFSMVDAQAQNKVEKSSELASSDSVFDEMLADDNRSVVYKDVLNNVDVAYTVRTSGLKEDIILRAASAPNIFRFDVTTDGLTVLEKEGTIFFVNSEGQAVFNLAPMYMEDANGKYSDKVEYAVEMNEGGYRITITADKEFLNASDTQFPLIIDPSILISGSSATFDTCVDEQYPSSNYYLSQNLWTGGLLGTNAMRTYIKFTLPTDIAAINITSAYLRIEKNAYSTPSIKAYRITGPDWTSSTIKWTDSLYWTSAYSSGVAYNDTGNWYRMYTTTLVKDWINGINYNRGFVLKEPSESSTTQKTRFYSSDAASPHKPELHILYSLPSVRYVSIKKAYDSTFINLYPGTYQSHINSDFSTIDDPFNTTWNIYFTHDSYRYFGDISATDCKLPDDTACNNFHTVGDNTCGSNCNTQHHKALLGMCWQDTANGVGTAGIQVTFGGFFPCDSGGASAGDYALIPHSFNFSHDYALRSMQHEISHLYGCPDHSPYGSLLCVMSGGLENLPFTAVDIWCPECENVFNRLAQ